MADAGTNPRNPKFHERLKQYTEANPDERSKLANFFKLGPRAVPSAEALRLYSDVIREELRNAPTPKTVTVQEERLKKTAEGLAFHGELLAPDLQRDVEALRERHRRSQRDASNPVNETK